MGSEARWGLRGRPLCCQVGDALRSISRTSMCWQATRTPGCRSSLRPSCDVEWFGRNLVGSISGSVSSQGEDHEIQRARTGLRPFRVSPRLGQATDLAVTQAVVDEDEKFAGGRYPSDLLAAALTHSLVVGPDGRISPLAGHRLDGGPPHQA